MKIMHVDDSIEMRNLVELTYPERLPYDDIHIVGDPEMALLTRSDIYILDYYLGNNVMNGDELSFELRKKYPSSFTISYSGEHDLVKRFNNGAYDEVLQKGNSLDILIATIEEYRKWV